MSHILSSHGGLEGALTAKLLLENPFCRKAFLEPSQIALGTGLAFCPSWPWHIPAATGYRSSMIISKFTSHRALLSGNACFDKPVVCIGAAVGPVLILFHINLAKIARPRVDLFKLPDRWVLFATLRWDLSLNYHLSHPCPPSTTFAPPISTDMHTGKPGRT